MFEPNHPTSSTHWERQTIQKVLLEHIQEQRSARRWGIFFKLIFLLLFLFMILWVGVGNFNKEHPSPVVAREHTAVIDIRGEISSDEDASADNIRLALKNAFENKHVKGIILRIDSPGGAPVQARQIFDEIMLNKSKYPGIKIYAAIEELGTSAAYLVAAACDFIYADKTSLVGSIGVKIESFGFVDAMQKVGVERRLYAAGKYKGILDPFSPQNPEEEAFIKEQLAQVHQAFINNVRQGRGERLKESPDMFTGLFWTGEQALGLGLIDGYGDAQFIAHNLIKAEIVDYSPTTGLLDRLANRIGASITKTAVNLSAGRLH